MAERIALGGHAVDGDKSARPQASQKFFIRSNWLYDVGQKIKAKWKLIIKLYQMNWLAYAREGSLCRFTDDFVVTISNQF